MREQARFEGSQLVRTRVFWIRLSPLHGKTLGIEMDFRKSALKRSAVVLVLAGLLAGCATSEVSLSKAVQVPSNRVYLQSPASQENSARATFIRDVGMLGSAVYQHLSINGERAASLNPGEFVSFDLPPGEHLFGAINTDPFGTTAEYVLDQRLERGGRYFYRILVDGNSMSTRIQRTGGVGGK